MIKNDRYYWAKKAKVCWQRTRVSEVRIQRCRLIHFLCRWFKRCNVSALRTNCASVPHILRRTKRSCWLESFPTKSITTKTLSNTHTHDFARVLFSKQQTEHVHMFSLGVTARKSPFHADVLSKTGVVESSTFIKRVSVVGRKPQHHAHPRASGLRWFLISYWRSISAQF